MGVPPKSRFFKFFNLVAIWDPGGHEVAIWHHQVTFWGGHRCHLGSHWISLGLMLAHILTLRGILGVPRTLLWLTFGSILTYLLLGEMFWFSMYSVIIVLLRMYFLCIVSLLFLHVVCLIYSLCVFCGHHMWLIWELCSLCASRPVVPRTPVSDRSHPTPLELKWSREDEGGFFHVGSGAGPPQ